MTTPLQPGRDDVPPPSSELRYADGRVVPLSFFVCGTCFRLVGLARPPDGPEVAYDALESSPDGEIKFIKHDCSRDTGDRP